jgi:hypothetical protein
MQHMLSYCFILTAFVANDDGDADAAVALGA